MTMQKLTNTTIALMLMLAAGGKGLQAQSTEPTAQEAAAALKMCATLADGAKEDGADKKAAKEAGERAEKLHRARLKANPGDAEARVALASVLSRCRTPFAGMMQIMSIV